MVGTDAPDVPTHFWLVHGHLEFPRYQDADLLPQNMKVFLSYNYQPHEHRVKLIKHMQDRGLENFGYLSTYHKQLGVVAGHEVGLGDLVYWQSHFLNIVNETTFRQHPELVVGEKIFKPILGLRPFIINGSPRFYDILESWGIDIFDDLFPVDDMRQPAPSLNHLMDRNHAIICDVIDRLKYQDLGVLYETLCPRLEYNRERIKELMFLEYRRLCEDDIELIW